MKVAVFFRVRKPLFMRSLVSLVDFFMLVMMFLMVELVLPVRRIIVVIVSHGSSERSDEEQCSGDAQILFMATSHGLPFSKDGMHLRRKNGPIWAGLWHVAQLR
jgi:hypothetical protein